MRRLFKIFFRNYYLQVKRSYKRGGVKVIGLSCEQVSGRVISNVKGGASSKDAFNRFPKLSGTIVVKNWCLWLPLDQGQSRK